ncbi:hypothetical protein GCM10009609_30330 [Pseudonocardia aurantiaca]
MDGLVEQLASRGARRIVLGPLGPDAVAELASEVMEAKPDQALLELGGTRGTAARAPSVVPASVQTAVRPPSAAMVAPVM